ncbi:histidine--tRNA ligase [Sphaerobacter thermophilus]|uniref:Histidine--tRNA ligase n=1 Tax=Sphaerobacter thermophilus (strain ATCC 49802 / DSM 20745 / KCCM 41009 / NCIMB 13125 / S 6022) TaxID=479434 RepID=D1C7T1_SPHTD|nr:histidine--tRNA ligase [Sphaerobacter thermophilus]ACZ37914.1 histidyl-tRNA synthetase [Sphaerobacter thermophilus DSM 20745]
MAQSGGRPVRPPQVLKGMRDILPQQMVLRQHVISTFRRVFERYGFEPIETPVLEYLDVLTGKYGEDEKLIYHFTDRGGREVGMRYDLTVPLARFVATHRHELSFPFKRYHIEPVFRADRPQRGRYRQFWQCDADIVGTASMLADAEVIMVWIDALSAIHMPNFVIHINHRKLLQSMAQFAGVPEAQAVTIHRAIDKLGKIGREGVREEMLQNGISPEAADRVLDLVELEGEPEVVLAELRTRLAGNQLAQEGIADLEELFRYLGEMNADPKHYCLDLALARGLDYYTGPVFEAMVSEPNIGSLGGAGRYDHLIGMFLGEDIPATGASLGLERIIDVIQELNLLPQPRTVTDVLVTIFGDEELGASLGFVSQLRAAGINAEVYLGERRDLRRQMQYADRKGIPLAAFLGPEEIAAGTVNLRVMASGEQFTVPVGEAVDTIDRLRVRERDSDGAAGE